MNEWQERIDALQALVTAPFVVFLIVLIVGTLILMKGR